MLRHARRTRLPLKPITIQSSDEEEDDEMENSSPVSSENNVATNSHNSTNNRQEVSGDLHSDVEENSAADSSNDHAMEVEPQLNSIEDILRTGDLDADDSLAPIVENSSKKRVLELTVPRVMTSENSRKLSSESETENSGSDEDEEQTPKKPKSKMQKIQKSAETSKKFTKSRKISKQTKKETIDDSDYSEDEIEQVEEKDAPPKRLTRGSEKKNEPKNEKYSNRPIRSTRNSRSTDNETIFKIEVSKVANKKEPKQSLQTKSSTGKKEKRDSLSSTTPNKTPQIPRKDGGKDESTSNDRKGVKRRLVLENTDGKNQVMQHEQRRRKVDDKVSSTEDEESEKEQKNKISKNIQLNRAALIKKLQKPIIPVKAKSKVPSRTENNKDLISVSSSDDEETPEFVEKASSSIKSLTLPKQTVVEQPKPKNQLTTDEALRQAAQRSNPKVHLENLNPALISKAMSIVELKRRYLAKQIELASKQMVCVDHDVYLKKLQAMQLEKELNIEPSAYTKDLIKQE